jgi:hypothetical protein
MLETAQFEKSSFFHFGNTNTEEDHFLPQPSLTAEKIIYLSNLAL